MRRVHGKLNITLDGKKGIGDELSLIIYDVLRRGTVAGLTEVAPKIQAMPEHNRYRTKHFHQFTGNTVAATTAAVVDAGKVVAMVRDDGAEYAQGHPELIDKGETVHLDDPVEGEPRTVTGSYDIDTGIGEFGEDFASRSADDEAKLIPFAGLVLASGPAYASGIADVWANALNELSEYSRSGKFGWHIKMNIAKAINNYGK